MTKLKLVVPHVFILLAGATFITSLLTYVIPSGSFDREVKQMDGKARTLLVPDTYQPVDKHLSLQGVLLGETIEGKATPVGLHGFLTAIPRGLEEAADIIFFIFMIGGVFGILQRTGVIAASLGKLLHKLGKSGPILTIVLMAVMAAGGSTLGMGEEFIPLIPVFLLVAARLGYDRIYGMALVLLASNTGFAAATTNPFTVSVAQSIAEIPQYSGMWFRLIFLFCALSLSIIHLLRYGAKIKRDPTASYVAGDQIEIDPQADQPTPFRRYHTTIILSCVTIFGFILYATQQFGWWMADMSGGFFLMAIIAVIAARLSLAESARSFVKGMEEMVVAAIVVGFARGISVIMVDGQILDTIVYAAANVLQTVPRSIAVVGMLIYQSCLNLLIPSGSGQAAVTMPLMAPLSDILGITRQTAVFAFTCGDGFSNMIIPTSGILMAMLGLARIPYVSWLKFILPIFLQLMLLAGVFLAIAVFINYQ